jgi:predicted ATPase
MARELGEQLLALAERAQDSAFLVEAHRVLGTTFYHLGELPMARVHLERGMLYYDLRQHRSSAFLYGQDSGVFCLTYAALALWLLGYPDQALKRSREALSLAQELVHFHSLAIARGYEAWLHQLRREEQVTQERAEETNDLCREHGFAFWLAMGTILRGWALAIHGQEEEGSTHIREGLAVWRGTGAEISVSHFLALLAESYGKTGQTEEALSAVVEALAVVDKTGERYYEAELYRLRGELTLQQAGSRPQAVGFKEKMEEAEKCFHKAIETAHKQQAKSLELRATMSLARLWQQQGKRDDARQMLAEVYNWFTEGFDTRDWQEAKALLTELEGQEKGKRKRQKVPRRQAAAKATENKKQ